MANHDRIAEALARLKLLQRQGFGDLSDEEDILITEISWLLALDYGSSRLNETCSEAPELLFRRLLEQGRI